MEILVLLNKGIALRNRLEELRREILEIQKVKASPLLHAETNIPERENSINSFPRAGAFSSVCPCRSPAFPTFPEFPGKRFPPFPECGSGPIDISLWDGPPRHIRSSPLGR